MSHMDDLALGVGERLRAERERLGLSQDALGKAGGINRQTQLRYETGINSPSLAYLHALAPLGVDVGFVATGMPTEVQDDEARLFALYRTATPELRAAALSVLASRSGAGTGGVSISGGNVGQLNNGPTQQGAVHVSMAAEAQKKTVRRKS